jgi:hypothetical protein
VQLRNKFFPKENNNDNKNNIRKPFNRLIQNTAALGKLHTVRKLSEIMSLDGGGLRWFKKRSARGNETCDKGNDDNNNNNNKFTNIISLVRIPAGSVNFSIHHRLQTGSGAHPASYPMGTRGSFPEGRAAGA